MEAWLASFAGFIWGYPVVILCLIAGIFFTLRFGFIQLRCFPHAISLLSGKYDNPNEHGQITHFQALSAALSGTIGLGNIAGVAIAIAMGGPGAVFWLWICGFLGMATKYIECTLGTHYRDEDPETGVVRGGPMQYILKGLGQKWWPMAAFYGVSIAFAAFGAGSMFQANQAASALNYYYHIPNWITGLVLFSLVLLVILGGIKRIGKVASRLVPTMCVIYVFGALTICFMNLSDIPFAFMTIIRDAFTGHAAVGGAVGMVIKMGIRRAIFSNEAGLGSAAIAHAAVKTDYPIREGIVASVGPFIDTIVVCTATAFVIILSGNYGTGMYQPSSTSALHFETQEKTLTLNTNWTIAKKNIPEETDKLRTHKDGKHVLTYSNNTAQHTSTTLSLVPFNKNKTTGIRLGYFQKTGGLSLRLLNASGLEIALFDLTKSSKQTNPQGAYIEGSGVTNQWNSAIIFLSDTIKSRLPEISTLQLQLIPTGQEGSTYFIDRIQPVQKLEGIGLTTVSFDKFIKGFGSIFITLSVFFFAFSTIITWSYYGETAAAFVFGKKIVLPYKLVFTATVFLGSIFTLSGVLNFADAMLGLMVIPNMIAIFLLSNKVADWTKIYFKQLKSGELKTYK